MRQLITLLFLAASCLAPAGAAMEEPDFLSDRGSGMHTSLFGSHVRDQELLVYAFYEYVKFGDFEYSPSELGFPDPNDYFGEATENEYLIFLSYGFTEDFMVEFESSLRTSVDFTKSPLDPSAVPATISESGLGDTEMQFRWRTQHETADQFEWIWFLETVFPLQDEFSLVGTSNWELAGGINLTKGHPWGTMMYKASLKYDEADGKIELGEFAVEYLKRMSDEWRVVGSLEGEDDELSIIGEAQYSFTDNAVLKLNLGLGLTKKAPDLAPEIGVMWSF